MAAANLKFLSFKGALQPKGGRHARWFADRLSPAYFDLSEIRIKIDFRAGKILCDPQGDRSLSFQTQFRRD
jgi:hypothetical protein